MQTKYMLIIGLMLNWACTQSPARNSTSMQPPPAGNPDATPGGAMDAGSNDRDGDGLTNEQEAMLNTNPDKADTDGDGYTDFEEVDAMTNPNDPNSKIYTGGWPYNQKKDEIMHEGWSSKTACQSIADCMDQEICLRNQCLKNVAIGSTVPRFVSKDQHGEDVELYDFANQGKLIALDMSTEWCEPCRLIARWLKGDQVSFADRPWWKKEYGLLKPLFDDQDVYWVTVLYEDQDRNDARPEVAVRWDEAYPNPNIPVLVDEKRELHAWIRPSGIPNVNIVNEDMTLETYGSRGLTEAFDLLGERFFPAPAFSSACTGMEEEASEPNDVPNQAITATPGTYSGGICADGPDFYVLDVSAGNAWKISLDFEHAKGDLDLMVWDPARNAAARFKPSNVGISSESVTDDEEIEFSKSELDETVFMGTWDDPVYIRVAGYRNASAPYTLTIEAL